MAPNAAPRRNYYLFGRPFHTTAVDPANADAGDALYGARDDDGEPDASVIARHALHAHVVRLDRDARAIRAPVPDDFVFACRAVGVVEDVDGFERCVMRE